MGEKVIVKDSFIMVDGLRTHVTETGQGEPVLLVHGLGGPLMWQRVLEPLASHFHVISIDLPGFGETEWQERHYSTQAYSDFLSHALEELTTQPVIIVGISFGGQVAATFASDHPRQVKRLVLMNSTGLMDSLQFLSSKFLWIAFSLVAKQVVLRNEFLYCWFGRFSFYNIRNRPHDLCKKSHQEVMNNGRGDGWLNGFRNVLVVTEGFRKLLSALCIPTLIMWGENDRTVPVKYALEFKHAIPSATVKILPLCGHSLPLEKPIDFCTAFAEFVQQHETLTAQGSTS